MFEYNGKIEDLQEMVNFDMYLKELLKTIWNFYSMERIFLLKITRFILEMNERSTGHALEPVFNKFLEKHRITNIKKSLFKQLRYSISEINLETSENCLNLGDWANRNNMEQRELFLCIILTLKIEPFKYKELKEFFNICQDNNFGSSPHYDGVALVISEQELNITTAVECGTFAVAFSQLWYVDFNGCFLFLYIPF